MSKQSFSPALNNNNINNNNKINTINNIIKFIFLSELNYDMSFIKNLILNIIHVKKKENLFIKGRYGEIRKGYNIINIYIEK